MTEKLSMDEIEKIAYAVQEKHDLHDAALFRIIAVLAARYGHGDEAARYFARFGSYLDTIIMEMNNFSGMNPPHIREDWYKQLPGIVGSEAIGKIIPERYGDPLPEWPENEPKPC